MLTRLCRCWICHNARVQILRPCYGCVSKNTGLGTVTHSMDWPRRLMHFLSVGAVFILMLMYFLSLGVGAAYQPLHFISCTRYQACIAALAAFHPNVAVLALFHTIPYGHHREKRNIGASRTYTAWGSYAQWNVRNWITHSPPPKKDNPSCHELILILEL